MNRFDAVDAVQTQILVGVIAADGFTDLRNQIRNFRGDGVRWRIGHGIGAFRKGSKYFLLGNIRVANQRIVSNLETTDNPLQTVTGCIIPVAIG